MSNPIYVCPSACRPDTYLSRRQVLKARWHEWSTMIQARYPDRLDLLNPDVLIEDWLIACWAYPLKPRERL